MKASLGRITEKGNRLWKARWGWEFLGDGRAQTCIKRYPAESPPARMFRKHLWKGGKCRRCGQPMAVWTQAEIDTIKRDARELQRILGGPR